MELFNSSIWLIFILYYESVGATEGIKFRRCGQAKSQQVTNKYYFTSPCSKSRMPIISSKNLTSLSACRQLATRKKAFAFNYLHKNLLHRSMRNFSGDTCLIYDCPEFDTSKWQDPTATSPYDYYSVYVSISRVDQGNMSCLPGVGLISIHSERKNYNDAVKTCSLHGGTLVDVHTETRTELIRPLLASLPRQKAYVGFSQLVIPDTFVTSNGDVLGCEGWTAWGPGEPRPFGKGPSCGLLSYSEGWAAAPCTKKYPYICEILPSGPHRPCKLLIKGEKRRCLRKYKRQLPKPGRNPKCGAPRRVPLSPPEESLTPMMPPPESSLNSIK